MLYSNNRVVCVLAFKDPEYVKDEFFAASVMESGQTTCALKALVWSILHICYNWCMTHVCILSPAKL